MLQEHDCIYNVFTLLLVISMLQEDDCIYNVSTVLMVISMLQEHDCIYNFFYPINGHLYVTGT